MCVLQLLDSAVGLAKFFLKAVDTDDEAGGVVRIAWRAAGDVGGRRRLAVEDIELCLRRRREREAGDEHSDEARAKRRGHWRILIAFLPDPYARRLSNLSRSALWRAAAYNTVLNFRPLR